jgi:hypothetical protein
MSRESCLSCVPKPTGIEVKVKLYNCRKIDREEVPVPTHTVYKEELSFTREDMTY